MDLGWALRYLPKDVEPCLDMKAQKGGIDGSRFTVISASKEMILKKKNESNWRSGALNTQSQ